MNNILQITLKNKKDYINSFNNDRISRDLNDYILEESKTFNIKKKIEIRIKPEFEMTEEEKNKLVDMIRLSYNDDVKEISYLIKKLIARNIFMFLLGLFILILYYFESNLPIMSEVILIIGWVLIWETIYNLFFAGLKNSTIKKRRLQLVNSNISFE